MKWLLILGSLLLLSGCAGVKEIETHSKENVRSIESLFSNPTASKIEIRENKPYPLIRSSEWIRVWKGSYSENGSISPEGWIYIRLSPETPETNF